MKTKLAPTFVLVAGFLALGAQAQVSVPSPAPAVEPAAAPAPGRFVYAPRLPTPTELTSVAAAQGLSVERIDQTSAQVVVTYKSASGQLSTVSYQLLPTAATPAPATTTVVTTTPAPTVVYAQPYAYPYWYADPFFYPWGYYGPVSVNLGFGFHGGRGYYGGYYRGHGHRRW